MKKINYQNKTEIVFDENNDDELNDISADLYNIFKMFKASKNSVIKVSVA